MLKRHHKLLIVITVVGIIVLLYLILKNRGGGSSSGDTSNIPTIISTGGGTISPSIPSFATQSFDPSIGAGGPASAIPTPVPGLGYTVMPGTSQSGVPSHTIQAQEFNTAQPVTNANPVSAAPSFYSSAQELHFNTLDPTYVQATSAGIKNPTNVADLGSYLGLTLRSFEIDAAQSFADAPGHGAVTPSTWQAARSTQDVGAILNSQADSYISQHPEVAADRDNIVQGLISAYDKFTGEAAAKYAPTDQAPTTQPSTPAPAPATDPRTSADTAVKTARFSSPAYTLDSTKTTFTPSTSNRRVM